GRPRAPALLRRPPGRADRRGRAAARRGRPRVAPPAPPGGGRAPGPAPGLSGRAPEGSEVGVAPGLVRMSMRIEDVEYRRRALPRAPGAAATERGTQRPDGGGRMAAPLPDNFKDLLQKKAFASLATVMADGSPQVTPVWFDWDGQHIRVNTAKGRVKDRNM